jgi:hypothetical protein
MKEAIFSRFYVEEKDFELYKELEGADDFIFRHHPELLLLSACIGYYFSLSKELENPKPLTLKAPVLNVGVDEDIFGNTIYEAFKSIAEKEGKLDESGRIKVNTIIEEYAKAGFKKLYEVLNEPGNKNENLLNFMLLYLD